MRHTFIKLCFVFGVLVSSSPFLISVRFFPTRSLDMAHCNQSHHFRPFNASASIGQNYHAMVQTAAIRDVKEGCGTGGDHQPARQLTVLTRRTMGVAALANGELE